MKKYNHVLILFAIVLFSIPIANAITYPTFTGYMTNNGDMITTQFFF